MSIDTLTDDEFMALDHGHHELAIQLCDERIQRIETQLGTTLLPEAAQRLTEEVGTARSLRKVHQHRLEELREIGSATLAVA